MRPFHVLICDDQPDVRHALHLMLKGAGYQTQTVDSPRELLTAARSQAFDLILADLNYTRDTTSGEEGLDLLASLEAQGNETPIVVMTAWGSIDLAVEAMRRGACDFIQKPWDNARALAVVRKQAESVRRRKSELEIAAAVQQRMFPHAVPTLASLEYAGHCAAAQGIGGDYYDFLDLGPGRVGFVLGDVSGKGVPAALLMANLQACFRSQSPAGFLDIVHCLSTVNQHFFASTTSDRYATLFFGIYDEAARTLRYVNCGHCPPLLQRADGRLESLDPTATPLGAFEEWSCEAAEIALLPGDTLLLYSDGVSEAVNPAGEEFGVERLVPLLRPAKPATALVDAITAAVSRFSEGTRTDDVTVVAIRAL
ncbi:MAG: SpoIIE family protein phosphatase [Acidobacteriota bacterium]